MVRRLAGRRDDRGAAAVEFALVVPLLLLLVFGIISFGLYFASALALSNSARQGARSAVVQNATCGDAASQVAQAGGGLGLQYPVTVKIQLNSGTSCVATVSSGGAVTFTSGSAATMPCAGSPADAQVTVTASGTTTMMVPGWLINKSFGVQGQGVYRCEFS